MSAPVDAVAWLHANLRSPEGRQIIIPAVAELVEAARDMHACLSKVPGMRNSSTCVAARAALAKFGGAK